jgi:hypothetical protein
MTGPVEQSTIGKAKLLELLFNEYKDPKSRIRYNFDNNTCTFKINCDTFYYVGKCNIISKGAIVVTEEKIVSK